MKYLNILPLLFLSSISLAEVKNCDKPNLSNDQKTISVDCQVSVNLASHERSDETLINLAMLKAIGETRTEVLKELIRLVRTDAISESMAQNELERLLASVGEVLDQKMISSTETNAGVHIKITYFTNREDFVNKIGTITRDDIRKSLFASDEDFAVSEEAFNRLVKTIQEAQQYNLCMDEVLNAQKQYYKFGIERRRVIEQLLTSVSKAEEKFQILENQLQVYFGNGARQIQVGAQHSTLESLIQFIQLYQDRLSRLSDATEINILKKRFEELEYTKYGLSLTSANKAFESMMSEFKQRHHMTHDALELSVDASGLAAKYCVPLASISEVNGGRVIMTCRSYSANRQIRSDIGKWIRNGSIMIDGIPLDGGSRYVHYLKQIPKSCHENFPTIQKAIELYNEGQMEYGILMQLEKLSIPIKPLTEIIVDGPLRNMKFAKIASKGSRFNVATGETVTFLYDYEIQTNRMTNQQWTDGSGDSNSVVDQSWDRIQEMASELGKGSSCIYRLPTEAEWEFAHRSSSVVFDTSLWEWTNNNDGNIPEGAHEYDVTTVQGPPGNAAEKVVRGYEKKSARSKYTAHSGAWSIGFRLVRICK